MERGFSQQDFNVFSIEGLDERMEGIRSLIQPKFHAIGEKIVPYLSQQLGQEMYLHVAKHARRSVNPPKDTWMAVSPNKRGYKKLPHFQVGLWGDNLFIWLAYIYELPNKTDIAKTFIENVDHVVSHFPKDGWISTDHMKNEAKKISEMNDADVLHAFERFQNIKKAELLIGKRFNANAPIVSNPDVLIQEIKDTYDSLIPLFRESLFLQEK
ncbi:DUF1054 domain-containing protein [Jeotgalibacillus soli]|uniref:UPF0637 protein KP78_22750 n=1 Tax=Jeotgalibacillus soli TaxID=889306 RepID=A0A0C2VJS4_9BACL|nr:DUF1054 domain-containing protein [Jeotgalibacillus soli]KIL44731.1 hypothetical protein KP78_22750 [Jeotgalibacillus soli]